jgi:2,3-bisphosphoglycerate-independent phosphoglycerate mutase
MPQSDHHSPVALIILDGWGIGRAEPGNAVLNADTPVMDWLWRACPHATLRTSGIDVGLPAGQMGNSEVGHTNLGAGFIVYQWITRIDVAIDNGEFFANPILNAAMDRALTNGGALHLLGLIGTGGVHAHSRHLFALLKLAKKRGLTDVRIHAFTDGRDTQPTSGLGFAEAVELATREIGLGRIATVTGRYFAMDRDHRWERTKLTYDAIADGEGPTAPSAEAAIQGSYDAGVTDEFIIPTVIGDPSQTRMNPGDEVIFFNFRSDRGRQLAEALSSPNFSGFERPRRLWESCPVTTLTRYEAGLPVAVAFEPHDVTFPIARAVSEAGLRQLHVAETEKYAHVTFFFNGGREAPFEGESRALIPSPKVATYNLKPEMSATDVTEAVVDAIEQDAADFIVVNYANGDMVGHTGVQAAATKAVETVDACLGRVLSALERKHGIALVTADHGNAEEMVDRTTSQPMTAHTTNRVPVILVGARHGETLRQDGILSAVAPTVLQLLGVPIPEDMTTPSLLIEPDDKQARHPAT